MPRDAADDRIRASSLFVGFGVSLTIDGATGLLHGVTLNAQGGSRFFDIDTDGALTLAGLTLTNGSIHGGNAGGGGGLGAGGAIFNRGTLLVDRCTLSNNSTRGGDTANSNTRGGGGAGTGPVDDASGGGPNGGGHAADGGFGAGDGNAAPNGNIIAGGGGAALGGAIFNDAGVVSISRSTLTGNWVRGGLAYTGAALSGNDSGYGGAIFNYNGSLTIDASTIAFNQADLNENDTGIGGEGNAGAVYSLGDTAAGCSSGYNACLSPGASAAGQAATLTITNSILSNSTLRNGTTEISDLIVDRRPGTNTSHAGGSGNLVQLYIVANAATIQSGTVLLSSYDPQLAPLADNGGTGWTLLPQPGSVALEAVACPAPPVIDQRGYRRYDTAACDIGAVQTTAIDRIFAGNFDPP